MGKCLNLTEFSKSPKFLDNFDKIGTTNSWGTRRDVSYNPKKGWDIRYVNIFMRIIEFLFGCYKRNADKLLTKASLEIKNLKNSDENLKKLLSKIETQIKKVFPKKQIILKISNSQKPEIKPKTPPSIPNPKNLDKKPEITPNTTSQKPIPPKTNNKIEINVIAKKTISPSNTNFDKETFFTHPNKKFVYNSLIKNKTFNDKVRFRKYQPNVETLKNILVFLKTSIKITQTTEKSFTYPRNTKNTIHITANFGDPEIFVGAQRGLFAQDEVQIAEHPALNHLKNYFNTNKKAGKINRSEFQAALITGAKRYGSFKGQYYGKKFALAKPEQFKGDLTILKKPRKSKIAIIVAPRGPDKTPYSKKDLEKLLYPVITVLTAIKQKYSNKKIVFHTGNWGAGAFGGSHKAAAIMQLLAARISCIDEIRYYPRSKESQYNSGKTLLETIENHNPKTLTCDQFIDHLAENAKKYNLIWEKPNNT
jgi:hypothetical protein